ncbi:hypothetical protein ACSRUE_07585 [Sorangium sp. KYC3313]|uniref:hypothetical protein n=1 Tax=Sorangium sp. KYC3313 TaxID=3449740 RepID=UPI003F8A4D09
MAAATKPAAGALEASEGISLAQYAAVRAAMAEGFPLADVLTVEGLKPRTFARADLAWKQRLTAELELLAAYEQELAQAEDWLDRQVEPLAEEPTAWASFLAAFGAHPAPFELLEENDLGMNDVARLRRRWARRAAENAKVGELLEELHAKPGKLGPLRIAPRVLRPSRVAEARGSAKGPADEHSAAVPLGEPGLGLAEYAALCAELDALPEQRERVLRRHGLVDEELRAALDRRWQAALERDAALAKDFERLQAHHARRLEMLLARAREAGNVERSPASTAASSAPAVPSCEAIVGPVASALTPAALQGTGPLLPVSPFAAADPTRRAGALAASRPAPHAAADLRETSLHVAIPRELLTQTASSPAPVTGAASQTSKASPPSKPSSTAGEGGMVPLPEPLETILPLAQYAALCAELALAPAMAESIFQRYGLGFSEVRSVVDAAWKERLRGSPAEYARWHDMYQRYYAHFARRGAPPR